MAKNAQAPDAVVMIRPHHFQPNPETAIDNAFQINNHEINHATIAQQAYQEVSQAADTLRQHGIKVHLFEDTGTETPDAVFPNNWFSTHASGDIVIYPMFAKNRRKERREDIINFLAAHYQVNNIIDYSHLVDENIFLEGTGAMVLDHINQLAYAVESNRCQPQALAQFCQQLNYQALLFNACDHNKLAIYHTNVLMAIGSQFALIGTALINNTAQRAKVVDCLLQSGREICELTAEQINNFCGNAIELSGASGPLLVLSTTAYQALTQQQIAQLSQYAQLLPLNVSTIEKAGGSIRCMLAGIHLTAK